MFLRRLQLWYWEKRAVRLGGLLTNAQWCAYLSEDPVERAYQDFRAARFQQKHAKALEKLARFYEQ